MRNDEQDTQVLTVGRYEVNGATICHYSRHFAKFGKPSDFIPCCVV